MPNQRKMDIFKGSLQMKTIFALSLLALSASSFSQVNFYGLQKGDQEYYKNDSNNGTNNRERTDSLVKELNRVIGEMNTMKSEIQQLKSEVEELKRRK